MDDIRLKDIYIGSPDGMAEAEKENFEELFYDPNNKYDELMDNKEKFIILGSKGTGKTYLAKYVIKKASKNQSTEFIDSSDFKLYKLSNINSEKLNDDIVYALCKKIILDKLSSHIILNHPLLSKIPYTNVNRLKQFFEIYKDEEIFTKEKIVSNKVKKRRTDLAISKSNLKQIKEKGVVYEGSRKQFFELLLKHEELVKSAMGCKDDIILIFDDIDELENQRTDEEAGNIIINLIKAAKEYNLSKRSPKGNWKILLLLRSDILNKLQSKTANLGKIRTSNTVELYWLFDSFQEKYNHPLMSMIFHKIRASCSLCKKWSNKEMYDYFFPDMIDGKTATDYLLDYSFGRPRDIIIYLNYVIKQYPNATCFTAGRLKETRKLYSPDLYDDVLNRASFQKEPEYTEQCFSLLSAMNKNSFSYKEISECYLHGSNRYNKITDLDEALEFLYELGAIGNTWKVKGTLHTGWSYKKDGMHRIDLDKKFTIHYGLRKKLVI